MRQHDQHYQTVVEKVWGRELWITNNELYCAKVLCLNPGYESSYHYHPVKDETFHVLDGSCVLNLNGTEQVLGRGATVRIAPSIPHSFWTEEETGCKILEISTTHADSDVVRLRESRRFNPSTAES